MISEFSEQSKEVPHRSADHPYPSPVDKPNEKHCCRILELVQIENHLAKHDGAQFKCQKCGRFWDCHTSATQPAHIILADLTRGALLDYSTKQDIEKNKE